jgi:integrase
MFRYGGRQFQRSLKTKDPKKADALKGKIELTLLELEQGRLMLPPEADIAEFVISDGRRSSNPQAAAVVTLADLFARYERGIPPGNMEGNSLLTVRIHMKHLLRLLGGRTAAQRLSTGALQGYVNGRSRERYRKKAISPSTIKKEVATFRSVWNWGKDHGVLTGEPPTRGLRYEKEDRKPPFRTWEEIERQVARGGLTEEQAAELWDALFLSVEQVRECLEHVRATPAAPFVYPMFVFVAHTGARRSEMLRSRVEDIDLEEKRVRIREKKKDRTKKETERYVDMSGLLEQVMRDWLGGQHPGGPFTFCQGERVARSRTRSRTTGHQSGPGRATTVSGRAATVRERDGGPGLLPLTKDEATHHFKRALEGSRWAVVRGFHVFRHSFASNLAGGGVSPQAIDALMGHQTEAMRVRYRHLFPAERLKAVRSVLG